MSAPIVRAHYDSLAQTAREFAQQAAQSKQTLQALRSQVQALQGGDWLGKGAQAFYAEMSGQIVPTLNRLVRALEAASQTTAQIRQVMQAAEAEAARHLRAPAGPGARAPGAAAAKPKSFMEQMIARAKSGGGGGGILSSIGGFFKSVGGAVKDFAIGVASEAKDMAKGIVFAVSHPLQTLEGLAYAVTHPIQTLKAIAQPFVEAWESGHPFQAIGRGFFAIGTTLLGGGGAVKAVRTARGVRSADALADVARARAATGLADDAIRVGNTVDEAGQTARGARAAGVADDVPITRVPPGPDHFGGGYRPPRTPEPTVGPPKRSGFDEEILDAPGMSETKYPGGRQPGRNATVGNFAHNYAEHLPNWLEDSGMIELKPGLQREYPVPHPDYPPGRQPRIDRLDREAGDIYEIKPSHLEAQGMAEAQWYAQQMDRLEPLPDGRKWQPRVVTYDMNTVERYMVEKGYLEPRPPPRTRTPKPPSTPTPPPTPEPPKK